MILHMVSQNFRTIVVIVELFDPYPFAQGLLLDEFNKEPFMKVTLVNWFLYTYNGKNPSHICAHFQLFTNHGMKGTIYKKSIANTFFECALTEENLYAIFGIIVELNGLSIFLFS